MAPDGKSAKIAATTYDMMSRKPKKVEMRLSIAPDGDHETELRDTDPSGKIWNSDTAKYHEVANKEECRDAKSI